MDKGTLMQAGEILSHATQAQDIYRALMKWLETGEPPYPGSTRDFLKLPPALAFRRINGMGGTVCAESVKDPRVRIAYDPNWDAVSKIEALLAER